VEQEREKEAEGDKGGKREGVEEEGRDHTIMKIIVHGLVPHGVSEYN
jgi:hypothetical protein